MDKCYKKISLEQAKNRTINNLEYYAIDRENHTCEEQNDKKSWGGYCVDILIPRISPEEDACIPVLSWVEKLVDTLSLEYVVVEPDSELSHNTLPDTSHCENGGCDPIDVKGAYWMRYKNMMMLYFWVLNTFIPSIQFYRKCKEGFQLVEVDNVSDVFDSDMQIIGDLSEAAIESIKHYEYVAPNTLKIIHAGIVNENVLRLFYKTAYVANSTLYLQNGLQIGELVGVTTLYDEFIKKFTDLDTAKAFLIFVDRLLDEGLFAPLSGATPYMDVEFSINNTQVDMGLVSPILETWVPKKKYYLGEKVFYNNKTYRLTSCKTGNYDLYEVTGPMLQDVLKWDSHYVKVTGTVPSEAYKLSSYTLSMNDNDEVDYKRYVLEKADGNGNTKYYFIQPYDTGGFSETTRTSKFDTTCWVPITSVKIWLEDDGWAETIDDDFEFTGITESQITTLKRRVSSVDDFGEQLPFIVKFNRDGNGAITGINTSGELYYSIGVMNEHQDKDGKWTGDNMALVYYSTDNSSWTRIYGASGTGVISYDDFGDSGVTNGYVKFIYYVGCDLDVYEEDGSMEKEMIEYTGVRFEETWRFSKQQMKSRISYADSGDTIHREWVTFDYINIHPIENNDSDTTNVDINGKQPIYSIVTYYGKQMRDVDYIYAPYYKDEDLLHIHDINTLEYDLTQNKYLNTINAYIQRGTAASFERHSILGEVKSLSDLENYRNNFFNI